MLDQLETLLIQYEKAVLPQDLLTTIRHSGRIEALKALKKIVEGGPWACPHLED